MKKLFLEMAIAIVTVTAVSAQEDKMVIPAVQTDKGNGYDENTATRCGIKFNINLSGVTKVELESVDGNELAGTAGFKKDSLGLMVVDKVERASTIITFTSNDKSGFTPGKDYYILTLPCNLYG